MNRKSLIVGLIAVLAIACFTFLFAFREDNKMVADGINYLPLGDSYTIGTGTTAGNCWPKVLTNHLNEAGIKTNYLGNPARNGFSTQDLIDFELPVLEKSKADFVTILIGVNDWVRSVDKITYEKNYEQIIATVQKKLGTNKKRILLVTIPDFGLTPAGKNYGGGRDISAGISEFNDIIKAKGKKYGLPVVDIFPISKEVSKDPELTAEDGLHPSAKGYAAWEKLILPVAKDLLKK